MKKLLLLVSLLCLTNCVTLQQLNSNLQSANEIMAENVQAMETSKTAIEENTKEIKRSTRGMQKFEILFPILFFVVFLALVYIFIRLNLFHRMFKN